MDEVSLSFEDAAALLTDEEFAEYLSLHGSQPEWIQCTVGVTESVFPIITKLFLAAFNKRLLVFLHKKGTISSSLRNLGVTASGLAILYTQNDLFLYICAYGLLIGFLPFFNKLIPKFGYFVLTYTIGTLLMWQWMFPSEEFMSMRGAIMILLMKISSLSFDLANRNCDDVSFLEAISYLLDGSTVIFGPWISIQQFRQSLNMKSIKDELIRASLAVCYILMSLCFLIYSSCIADSYVGIAYLGSYFSAQSFRFSHYFIVWLSEGASTMSGSNTDLGNSKSGFTNWISIEWPRSLVDVVVSWNIPMHTFLHKYVFAEVRRFGTARAIFATYSVSSLLHGLNFQLSAVLLSLGLYTYAETRLRSKLSRRWGLCIRIKKCAADCQHKKKEKKYLIYVINFLFRTLAMLHLIYLGMVFDNSAAEIGYSWKHTLSLWSKSYFYSHIIAVVTLLASSVV